MQTPEMQMQILHRRAMRKITKANRKKRKVLIHAAAFLNW
jgi:hypothetical protein